MSFLIAVPTGVKFFNWIGTLWRRQAARSRRRCCSRSASCSTFLFGGVTGVMLAAPPLDFHVTDSYFVVAHFHYVLAARSCSRPSRHLLLVPEDDRQDAGRAARQARTSGPTFIGFNTTFLVQHWLGIKAAPPLRRLPAADGFTTLNPISTIGAFILGVSTPLPLERREDLPGNGVPVDDPWVQELA